MLVPYKTINHKIAMGLLSFMPNEKDIKRLQQTMDRYVNDEDWKLYLWKEEDFVGVVGISIEQDVAKLQHLCVNPSFRQEGIGKKIVLELQNLIPLELIPTKETMDFWIICSEKKQQP